jgi:hypothetical protein
MCCSSEHTSCGLRRTCISKQGTAAAEHSRD